MTARTRNAISPNGKTRLRSEIVEAMRGLNKIGAIGDDELRKTTMRMPGAGAVPKITRLSPGEIAEVREKAGLSQSVLAGYFSVAVNTVGQWERRERRPTGAALKLLHVVKRAGVDPLR